MTTAALPPLAAAMMDSVPSIRSFSVRWNHPLEFSGHMRPGTRFRLQNLTWAARQSRSSLLSGVKGVWATGNKPRHGLEPGLITPEAMAVAEAIIAAAPSAATPAV